MCQCVEIQFYQCVCCVCPAMVFLTFWLSAFFFLALPYTLCKMMDTADGLSSVLRGWFVIWVRYRYPWRHLLKYIDSGHVLSYDFGCIGHLILKFGLLDIYFFQALKSGFVMLLFFRIKSNDKFWVSKFLTECFFSMDLFIQLEANHTRLSDFH